MTPKSETTRVHAAQETSRKGISRRTALRRVGGGGAAVAGAAMLSGGARSAFAAQGADDTSRDAYVAIADGIIAALNGDDPDALDAWVAPDAIGHVPLSTPEQGKPLSWIKDRLVVAVTAFPTRNIEVKGLIFEGDQISAHGTFTGKHEGPLQELSPTGGEITVAWLGFVKVTDGKVSEYWYQLDTLGALEQFGLFALDGVDEQAAEKDEAAADY